ncbi:hypothetical protein ANN_11303 [Periplaneta americana]|uniref:Uncharacterized protein n=1 Tax=Periplaneta americana TaxID=6978 RepID=A0ABQ8T4L9_PERAM|nr:hypothetical protein ANN_11303 [Periplaneta americana]
MAGLCEGGNEPLGSLKASVQPMTTQLTGVQPMTSQLCTVIKPQVLIILGYAVERELAKSHGGWKSNTDAEDSLLPPSMGMMQSYPAASDTTGRRVTKCSTCINNNVRSNENEDDAVGGQKLYVEFTSSGGDLKDKEIDCSVVNGDDTSINNDVALRYGSEIQDGDCDVMLQSCEEVLTDEPNNTGCTCPRETVRGFTRTGSLPKKWKDSMNNRTKAWGRSMTPPYRMTSDGTIVNYWCDIPRRSVAGSHGVAKQSWSVANLNAATDDFRELDDGAYNPLWTMRGFTQTFHFWKETRRAQSVPLNAFLTYITLPWWSIAKADAELQNTTKFKYQFHDYEMISLK